MPSVLYIPCGIIFGTYFYVLFESVLSFIRMNNANFEGLTAVSCGMWHCVNGCLVPCSPIDTTSHARRLGSSKMKKTGPLKWFCRGVTAFKSCCLVNDSLLTLWLHCIAADGLNCSFHSGCCSSNIIKLEWKFFLQFSRIAFYWLLCYLY